MYVVGMRMPVVSRTRASASQEKGGAEAPLSELQVSRRHIHMLLYWCQYRSTDPDPPDARYCSGESHGLQQVLERDFFACCRFCRT